MSPLAISQAHLTSENLISRFPPCRPRFQQFRRYLRSVQPAWPAQRHIKYRTRRALRRRKLARRLDQVVRARHPRILGLVVREWSAESRGTHKKRFLERKRGYENSP